MSIPIRAATLVIMRQHDDIRSGGWIDCILLMLEIIGYIVNTKPPVKANFVVLDINAALVCIREVIFIAVVSKWSWRLLNG